MSASRYYRASKHAREPQWSGPYPPLPKGDQDWEDMNELYRSQMQELKRLRILIRGSPVGVSMPRFTLEDFWAAPHVLEAYLVIDRWKWQMEQIRRERQKDASLQYILNFNR